jgi:hypothetical protein
MARTQQSDDEAGGKAAQEASGKTVMHQAA